jgi:methylmalonyl-CoA/ethylmalonyl-CoA epimerase
MTPLYSMRLHHFGLAARDPDRAESFLAAQGFSCKQKVYDPLQDVFLRWCERSESTPVEIVTPPQNDGPLARLLSQQGSSFYHLCYEVDWPLDEAVVKIREAGMRIITVRASMPAVLFGGRSVSFHMIQGFGLVELLEAEPAPQRISLDTP